MERNDIETQLAEFIINELGMDLKYIDLKRDDISLFSPEIGLEARELIIIFFESQKKFGVLFTEGDILNNRFDYFQNIVDCIYKKLVNGHNEND